MEMQKMVSLHESTVKEARKHVKTARKRPSKARTRVKTSVVKVDSRIVSYIAKNHIDWKRIEVIGPEEILVHNKEIK